MKSLDKALDILELFLEADEDISLSDLARMSGLDKSTVNRITTAFVRRGYLKQQGKRGKYSLGAKFLDYSGIVKKRIRIRDLAIPHMTKLAASANESVILATLDGQQAVHSETVHANHPLRIVPDEGTKVPLYCTGVGKILLAYMAEQGIDSYIESNELKRFTSNTITDPNQLRTHLVTIAKEGIAYDDEENYVGVRNVAAPVRDREGKVVASVGVLGPTVRLTRTRMLEVVPDVKECALKISRELGFKD